MRPLIFALAFAVAALPAAAENWSRKVTAAKGKPVAFHAWAGDAQVNAYIAWAADEVARRYEIRLTHVKVADIAQTVSSLLAEADAGARDDGGAADLLWLNGENFAALKARGLLREGWTDSLPNAHLIDRSAPWAEADATIPLDGAELPWGTARFVFLYDPARTTDPPATLEGLRLWAARNPGRFTYPRPPDFLGTTFLKQILLSLHPDAAWLAAPPGNGAEARLAGLFAYLDRLHPHLWRGGRAFPRSGPVLRQLLGDGELDLAFTFNPADAATGIATGQLPPTVEAYGPAEGGIANAHYLAIPKSAANKAAAMVVANFLISPDAQARKADPRIWGDGTVLAAGREATPGRDRFGALRGEPHPGWTTLLEELWLKRYGGG